MTKLLLSIAAVLLTGCAAPPSNTPGAGRGETYTPIVDMQGVDPARYSADLGDCRRYAGVVDSQKAAMEGAIGGAIMGAVISAMLGGGHNSNMQVGSATGFAGLTAAENRASGKQERVIINCMTGRGYRALTLRWLCLGFSRHIKEPVRRPGLEILMFQLTATTLPRLPTYPRLPMRHG